MRPSGRKPDQLRAVSFERGFTKHAEGSCLVRFGDTHVLCTASLEERVPPWLKGGRQGLGHRRIRHAAARHAASAHGARPRPASSPAGRRRSSAWSAGRSARSWIWWRWANARSRSTATCCRPMAAPAPPPSPVRGWRFMTASPGCRQRSMFKSFPMKDHVAAISCGIHNDVAVLDLDYAEDSTAGTDANFVMTGTGGIVEIQGTAEGESLLRGRSARTAGAGQEGHRRTGGPAEGRRLRDAQAER